MFEPLQVTRVVSTPAAIDGLQTPDDAIVLRTSPDETLVVGAAPQAVGVPDPHAIVASDAGWHGAWLSAAEAQRVLAHGAHWQPPLERPALAQGMILHLPVKLWLEDDRVLFVTPHTVAADMETRIRGIL